jgi:membrane protein implicated in regulation of membrane protease activity
MTITFTKKHLFVFLLTILIIGFSFALFFAQELQWLFATILGLLVLASVFLVFQNRDKTGIKQKKYSEKKRPTNNQQTLLFLHTRIKRPRTT